MHFVVTSVIPPAAIWIDGDAHFVGVLYDECPEAFLGPPVLEGRISPGRILYELLFSGEEVLLGNLGINLLVQVGAGGQNDDSPKYC